MEGVVILLVLFLLWLFIAPILAMAKAGGAVKAASEARDQVAHLMRRVRELEYQLRNAQHGSGPPEPPPVMPEAEERLESAGAGGPVEQMESWTLAAADPPPIPASQGCREALDDQGESAPPPASSPAPAWVKPETVAEPKEPFSWERFMGVKLFAWLGGVAMFFGVIFFVKYAFENNLVPPAVRTALGFVTGTALLIGGLATHRLPRYRVLAQAFCATGVLILYGVSFAAHAVYHFPAFGPVSTLVLMGLITLAAFLIAVRLNALVVAVLGMLGGFLTPVLLSTGHDPVFGWFGYIALLDIGLLAVSRHSNWRFLNGAAAFGTALMQVGWYGRFFTAGRYFEGTKFLIPMGILVFFLVLFLAAVGLGNRKRETGGAGPGSLIGLAAVAMAFAFSMLSFHTVAERYFVLYGFVLLVNLAVIGLAMLRPMFGGAQLAVALLTFLHLAFWTNDRLKPETLVGALALYLVFGALHAVIPVVLAGRMPGCLSGVPRKAGPWFAPLVVLMMLLPVLELPSVPMFIWVAVLLANLLAIGLATTSGAVLPVLASLGLTMGMAAMWLWRAPAGDGHFLMPFLGVISGFSAVFAIAGRWLFRMQPGEGEANSRERLAASLLPACSGLLPFGLLVLALLHLPVGNPSPVFGVALLLSGLLGGLALLGRQGPLVPAALAGTVVVEAVWHVHHFQPEAPLPALLWYLGFYGLFLLFPFVFRRQCAGQALPWIAGALSGAGHFLLVHDLVKRSFPNDMMGLVPAAFAVPTLAALVMVVRSCPAVDEVNRSRMAWFGGVALLFITLIFPIQFDRQWLTVSWAIEGALLLWLFHRVPHPGLQLTGLALLAVAFVRLALNPAVFTDYPRSGTAVFNWHLYVYGLVAAAQFRGASWFRDPAGRWARLKPRGVLSAFGGILLFLLLNIEIADYFTDPGDRFVAFRFGGNFARDMTCSIAWGLFSLGLLGLGIWRRSKQARFAAIGLLVVTLLKVFLHDLAAIENIFRIGALVGVAVIAFIASFLYQRFFDKPNPS